MKIKKIAQNIAIFFMVAIGAQNLISAFPFRFLGYLENIYSRVIPPEQIVFQRTVSFLLGLLMLMLVYRLYKKVRLAWILEVSLLFIAIIFQIIRFHRFTVPIVLIEFFALTVLLATYRDYGRKSDPLTLKKALIALIAPFSLFLINFAVAIFVTKASITSPQDLYDALSGVVRLFILMDTSVMETSGVIAHIYAYTTIWINWICIFISAFLLLKPLIRKPMISKRDRENVRRMALAYGQNPVSYLALESDKRYFFSRKIDGVCAYVIINDVFVVCGDMICRVEDGGVFLQEILAYCDKNAYIILFVDVTGCFLETFRSSKFGVVKLGEDCCFNLRDYSLAGGKAAKARAAINHAVKAGITVHEYKPLQGKNPRIESQIADISSEWLKSKGGYELQFTVGGTSLSDPMDRRYFYSDDPSGRILGFVVFLPYAGGYLADVTRRRGDAPQGALEKIIYDAFMQFKAEGIEWGNMGLSPLFNISESDKSTFTEKLFTFVYDNMNGGYGFKKLHHAKEKYAPTDWDPRYLAFYPRVFTTKLAFALVRSQFKSGIGQMILSEVLRKNAK